MNRDFEQDGDKWRPMLILSIVLHVIIFSAFLWAPWNGSSDSLRMDEIIYEVDLVSLSEISQPEGTAVVSDSQTAVTRTVPTERGQARRIYTPSTRENKVNVARRISKRSSTKPKETKLSSSAQLEKAISGIEKKVKTDDSDYLEKVIAGLEKKTGSKPGKASGKSSSSGSLGIKVYQMKVETQIKSQWAYPDALRDQKKIEAVVILKVSKDGTVLSTRFAKRSKNSSFDDSVLKAIEKAKPLPPLYKGFKGTYEELEINFNLRDLE